MLLKRIKIIKEIEFTLASLMFIGSMISVFVYFEYNTYFIASVYIVSGLSIPLILISNRFRFAKKRLGRKLKKSKSAYKVGEFAIEYELMHLVFKSKQSKFKGYYMVFFGHKNIMLAKIPTKADKPYLKRFCKELQHRYGIPVALHSNPLYTGYEVGYESAVRVVSIVTDYETVTMLAKILEGLTRD